MSATIQIHVTCGSEATQTIKDMALKSNTAPRVEAESLINYFQALASGQHQGSYDVQVNYGTAVAATDTITFTATNTANDTILINGVTMTAVTSGATNNQWNLGGGTATQQAAAFVAAVNASTTSLISGQVTASNVAGVVTLTSNFIDISGNAVTVAKGTDAGPVMTVATARLTGGVNKTANVYHFGA